MPDYYYYAATALTLVAAFVIRSFYDLRYPFRGKECTIGKEQVYANVFGASSCIGFLALFWWVDELHMGLRPFADALVRSVGVAVAVCSAIMMTWPRVQRGRREFWGGPKVEPEWFVAHVLTTTGAYRMIRHPYYLGVILTTVATSLTAASYAVCIIPLVSYFVMRNSAIEEERLLTRTYGDSYREYASRSWRLIPLID
jgi:protein-S-isoprenylcysteine O-methyltransferase Ste14